MSESKTTLLRKDGALRLVESERQALEDQVASLQTSIRADKDEISKLKCVVHLLLTLLLTF